MAEHSPGGGWAQTGMPPSDPLGIPLPHPPHAARSARRQGSPYPKAGLLARGVGRSADLIVSLAFSALFHEVGVLAGLLYLLVADALWHGQSIGKKIAGTRAVHVPDRTPAGLKESMLRNLPFALAFLFYSVPLIGWLLFFVVGLPVIGFEGYMVYSDALGIRIGDIFADTQVIDGKVVAGQPIPVHPSREFTPMPRETV
jgi:uncharacterized RDD family membrane protein YckC